MPTDVTGEGPTISLGLMRLLVEEGRAAMDGRRELDSGEKADLSLLVLRHVYELESELHTSADGTVLAGLANREKT